MITPTDQEFAGMGAKAKYLAVSSNSNSVTPLLPANIFSLIFLGKPLSSLILSFKTLFNSG